MTKNHCAICGKGKVEFRKTKNFETMVQGVPFTVPEATIGYCTNCGARVFDPKEVRRWRKLYEDDEVLNGRLLSAVDITRIRQALGLQINQFALLLGTTRQSVYNWERAARTSPQLRLVDLLLRLIRESNENGAIDVVEFLRKRSGLSALQREIQSTCPPKRSVRRRSLYQHRNRRDFDQIFGQSGRARELPRLSMY